jgi:hypothetical protein
MAALWDVASCSLVETHRYLEALAVSIMRAIITVSLKAAIFILVGKRTLNLGSKHLQFVHSNST